MKLSLRLKPGRSIVEPQLVLALVGSQGRALQLLPDPPELFATGEASGRRRACTDLGHGKHLYGDMVNTFNHGNRLGKGVRVVVDGGVEDGPAG